VVAFAQMGRGIVVGEPTGGNTGQPLSFPLPGGGSARVRTKHDRFADGTEFIGVGIRPSVVVHPSLAGIRAGRTRRSRRRRGRWSGWADVDRRSVTSPG
jgi:C-terminal processing protease CtpA/Prc